MKNDNLRVSRWADFIRATELKCAVWVFHLLQVELIITVTPLQASFLFKCLCIIFMLSKKNCLFCGFKVFVFFFLN